MKFVENLLNRILNISYSWVKDIQIYYIIRVSRDCLPVDCTQGIVQHLVQIPLFVNIYVPGI